jgi:hypothetical protein
LVARGIINDQWLSSLSHPADLNEAFDGAPVANEAGYDCHEQAAAYAVSDKTNRHFLVARTRGFSHDKLSFLMTTVLTVCRSTGLRIAVSAAQSKAT